MLYFIGLSILQNGKLPQFLSDKIIHDIFMAEKSQCVKYLIQGFEKFGIFQVDFNAFNITRFFNNKFLFLFVDLMQISSSARGF